MAITAIQPITNFSMILPPTAVAPAEVVSVASDFVTTPTSSTIVTLGETQPTAQPLFDSSGQLVAQGTEVQTLQSQVLASELTAAVNASSSSFDSFASALNVNVNTALGTGTTTGNLDLATLALELNILNASGLSAAGLANASNTADFSGILGTNVELAIAGIGTGGGGTSATGTLNPNANALNVAATNAVLTAPTTTPTTTTTTAVITPVTAPTATAPAAVAPIATAPVATAPAATAPAATVPVATVPIATAPPATATPVTETPVTPAIAAMGTAPVGLTPADVLQQLIADVNGRAVANLIDPGFASTSAGLFVSAAIFRAMNGPLMPGIGTADIAGNPPAEVTALQPARAV
jgi:hypothetical protein